MMRLRRLVRYLCLDRNPLRRRSDRIEAWLTMLLAATFLFVGPVAAWRTGHTAYRNAAEVARIADRGHVRVEAVLEHDAVLAYAGSDGVAPQQGPVWATWKGPDGVRQRGMVVPDIPAPAGTVVPVWVDANGNLAPRPRTDGDFLQDGISTGLGLLLILFGVCAGSWMLVRRLVSRRRMACWQQEWVFVEPRWSGRR